MRSAVLPTLLPEGIAELGGRSTGRVPLAVSLLPRAVAWRKIVLASHNMESQSAAWKAAALGRGASDWWARFVERVERAAVAGADLILAVSPEER